MLDTAIVYKLNNQDVIAVGAFDSDKYDATDVLYDMMHQNIFRVIDVDDTITVEEIDDEDSYICSHLKDCVCKDDENVKFSLSEYDLFCTYLKQIYLVGNKKTQKRFTKKY